MGYYMKVSEPSEGYLPELLIGEVPEAPKTTQTITIVLGYPPEQSIKW